MYVGLEKRRIELGFNPLLWSKVLIACTCKCELVRLVGRLKVLFFLQFKSRYGRQRGA